LFIENHLKPKPMTAASFETEYQLQEFREIQSEYFDEDGKAYQAPTYKTGALEQMLNLINQLEKELNDNGITTK
jgi:hypothetical protein